MASVGMNVARDGSSSPDLVRSLGCTWIRVVALPDVDLSGYFSHCRALGLQIMLVLARESGGNYAVYQRRYGHLIDCVQVGNEPDLASPSSWTMSPVELASLGRSARQVFGQDMPIVTAGMASGHPEWLAGMDLSWADAVAVQPYLKDAPNPNDIEDLPDVTELVAGYQALGKPLIISEWGWWGDNEVRGAEEVGDMTRWAAATGDVEVYFHFCLDDGMVPPFGLYRADGTAKPAAGTFISAAAGAIHSLWPNIEATVDPPPPAFDPWQFWSAEQISDAIGANLDHVRLYWPKLAEQLNNAGIYDRWTAIAELATIAVEVGARFEPIHEYGTPADWAGYSGGSQYAGRGFIQLTHDYNYRYYGRAVADLWNAGDAPELNLEANPDGALNPDVAAAVMAVFFRDHGIPEMAAAGNWAGIRRAVNGGMTGWQTFADAVEALKAISAPEQPAPVPPSVDPRDQTIADLTLALRTLRDETIPAIRAQVDEAERIAIQFAGARP
jgi:predicted chitinase